MYDIFEQLLQKHGATAYQVSKATGISTGTLSDWKAGRSTPKQDKLKKIADFFGVTVDYLMGSDEEKKENVFEAKNPAEKEMLLLCRKVNDAPEEVREEILNQFKSTVNIYLKAMGLNKED